MAKGSYKSLDALRASDEYRDSGVLGRDRLTAEHFPELMPVSNQQGTRRIAGPDRVLVEHPAHAG